EQAVSLRLSQSFSALELHGSKGAIYLYRATAEGLATLLELESQGGNNELYAEDVSRYFEVRQNTQTHGYNDIRVTTTRMKDGMDEEERGIDTETTILRWTGDEYDDAEP